MIHQYLKPINTNQTKSQFFNAVNNEINEPFHFQNRGIAFITDESIFGDLVRTNIEKLKNHFKNITIYDAGKLDSNNSATVHLLIEQLNKLNIVPIFLGIPLDNIANIAVNLNKKVLQISNKTYNLTNTNAFIDSNYIAFQRHLCELDDVYEIENQHFNSLSLGKLRSYNNLLEPVLRSAELMYINFNALRASESQEVNDAFPTGLNAEELCQIVKYAGSANYLTALFFDVEGFTLNNKLMSLLVSECIWYLSEGINMNFADHPLQSDDFSEFIVYSTNADEDLIFLKHNQTNRWWIKKSVDGDTSFIACSYEEYQAAINEEIPDRIQKFLNAN
jgi:hypothetical protein